MLNEAFVHEFRRHGASLGAGRERLQAELGALLAERGIEVHLVSGRVKSEASLRRKLGRPDRTYAALWDVTDLVGLRVTTYFEDAIDEVARAVEERFQVDFEHSIDKLRVKDQGRFGYRSLHYVCGLPGEPTGAPALPAAFRFEIQLRTVLQHAWAEVEHDLGYQAPESVPENVRRRFSRVAGLLEIADQEFVSIRRDLERYAREVRDGLALPGRPFPLDVVSLKALASSPEVREVDEEVATLVGRPISDELFFPEYLVRMLRLSGHATSEDLQASLRRNRAHVTALVRPYFEFTRVQWKLAARNLERVQRGYGLFFLSHSAILRSRELEISKVEKLTQLYRELDYPDDERAARRFASGLLAALQPAEEGG